MNAVAIQKPVRVADAVRIPDAVRYAKVIQSSKRVRWDIDADVIRGRRFDHSRKFLPDGLSLVGRLDFLGADERRFMSQVQGRTYANMFGLVERFIGAKMLEVTSDRRLGDQVELEALVRFTDEELKHQELFRRIEAMMAEGMPEGYRFLPQSNEVARAVLDKCTWAVLGLTCHIELFTLVHYRESLEKDPQLSELFKDVFLYHWKEESQHAILDELEWRREDARLDESARDAAVDDLIELVGAVDGILAMQAKEDAAYFRMYCSRKFGSTESQLVDAAMLEAYRWQYIVSGVQEPRFDAILRSLITERQMVRIGAALAPILR
jgi:hypothetical protein